MSNRKDMRRVDLVIPYQTPAKESSTDLSSTLASTMPMAAMFTRNKFIGWASVVFATQTWLGESETSSAGQPGIMSVGMSLLALIITYLPLFMDPGTGDVAATGTEAPAPQVPA